MCSAFQITFEGFEEADLSEIEASPLKAYRDAVVALQAEAAAAPDHMLWPKKFPYNEALASSFHHTLGTICEQHCVFNMNDMRMAFHQLIIPFQEQYGMPVVEGEGVSGR